MGRVTFATWNVDLMSLPIFFSRPPLRSTGVNWPPFGIQALGCLRTLPQDIPRSRFDWPRDLNSAVHVLLLRLLRHEDLVECLDFQHLYRALQVLHALPYVPWVVLQALFNTFSQIFAEQLLGVITFKLV